VSSCANTEMSSQKIWSQHRKPKSYTSLSYSKGAHMPVCPTSHSCFSVVAGPLNIATDEYYVPKVQGSLSRITTHIPGAKGPSCQYLW
jgi:hypothetical protein